MHTKKSQKMSKVNYKLKSAEVVKVAGQSF